MLHDASGPTWSQTVYLPAHGDSAQADLSLTTLGRFSSRGGFDLRQTPSHVSFHVVHSGVGHLEAEGRRWQVRPNSVFTFVPHVPVRYADTRDRPWRYTWFVLTGTRAAAVAARIGGSAGPWSRDDLPLAHVSGILDSIEAAFRAEDHSPYFTQSAAWRLMDGLSPRAEVQDRTDYLAVAIRRILDEQFALPLKLGALAKQLHVDRSTLFRRFQQLYGCSPKTYLDRLRLDHAVALLREGTHGISEIAGRCGYSSAPRFGKAFKGRFGTPPSRYLESGDGRAST